MNPEKGIPKVNLSIEENLRLKTLKFNAPPMPVNPDCKMKEEESKIITLLPRPPWKIHISRIFLTRNRRSDRKPDGQGQ